MDKSIPQQPSDKLIPDSQEPQGESDKLNSKTITIGIVILFIIFAGAVILIFLNKQIRKNEEGGYILEPRSSEVFNQKSDSLDVSIEVIGGKQRVVINGVPGKAYDHVGVQAMQELTPLYYEGGNLVPNEDIPYEIEGFLEATKPPPIYHGKTFHFSIDGSQVLYRTLNIAGPPEVKKTYNEQGQLVRTDTFPSFDQHFVVADTIEYGPFIEFVELPDTYITDNYRFIAKKQDYSYYLISKEGEQKIPYTWVDTRSIKISPDGKRYAYLVKGPDEEFWVVDGIRHKNFVDLRYSASYFSEDSKHFIYTTNNAIQGTEKHWVKDGEVEKTCGPGTIRMYLHTGECD